MKEAYKQVQERIWRLAVNIPESKRPVVLGVLIGVVAAAGLFYGWQRYDKGGVQAEEPNNSYAEESVSSKLFVQDQLPGKITQIRELSMDRSVWIAIHEDAEGKPGKILGARRFPSGSILNGEIELLRGMTPGLYYAMAHEDDGVLGFNHASDIPAVENGLPIMARFIASDNPEVAE